MYSYMRLPMGIAGVPDISQEEMSDLMRTLEYVRTYLDDLLVITKGSFDDNLVKIEAALKQLHGAKLRVKKGLNPNRKRYQLYMQFCHRRT